MTGDFGTITGPRVQNLKPRIDFFHGVDWDAGWDEVNEVLMQRQAWVKRIYGPEAFEDAPLLEPFGEYHMGDAGKSWHFFKEQISESRRAQMGIFLTHLEAEHAEHHFVRVRPWCRTCRGGSIELARLSLAAYVLEKGSLPPNPSDTELDWDEDRQLVEPEVDQADLYVQMKELEEFRPPIDLIEGIIPRTGVGYITGRDRSLKTFLALDMALTTAFMLPYWHFAHPLHHAERLTRRKNNYSGYGRILFAAGEGLTSFAPRIQAWVAEQHVQHYGARIKTPDGKGAVRRDECKRCEGEQNPDVGHVHHVELKDPKQKDPALAEFVLMPGMGTLEYDNMWFRQGVVDLFAGQHDYLHLLARARRDQPDIIVVDTLALASGKADHQSNSEMGQVHENARRLANASGGVVIIIAHTDKGDHDARGASAIEDNADFVLHCQRIENEQLEVKVAKRKDAEDNWTFAMGITEVTLANGVTSLILHDYEGDAYDEESADPDLDVTLSECGKFVIDQKRNVFTIEEIRAGMPRGRRNRNDVAHWLDRLANTGRIIRIQDELGKTKTFGMTHEWIAWESHLNPHLFGWIKEENDDERTE